MWWFLCFPIGVPKAHCTKQEIEQILKPKTIKSGSIIGP